MAFPTWVGYVFAVVLMVVGVYCLGRLVAGVSTGRRSHYGVNLGHVLMAVAMVGMLVPRWSVLSIGLWEAAFGVMAVWFAALAVRTVATRGVGSLVTVAGSHFRHYLIHAVMACAMLYMYWLGMPLTMHGSMEMGAATGAGDPAITLFLLLTLLGSVAWQLNGIERYRPATQIALVAAGVGGPSAGVELAGSRAVGSSGGADRPWLAPRLEVGCHIAMCIAMAYMLVLVV